MRAKTPLHARSHGPGGSDPMTGLGFIQYDKLNDGNWLSIETNAPADSGFAVDVIADNSQSIHFLVVGPGGEFHVEAPFFYYHAQDGIYRFTHSSLFDVQSVAFQHTGTDFALTESNDVTITASGDVDVLAGTDMTLTSGAGATLRAANGDLFLYAQGSGNNVQACVEDGDSFLVRDNDTSTIYSLTGNFGSTLNLLASGAFEIKNHLGASIFRVDEDGTITGAGGVIDGGGP